MTADVQQTFRYEDALPGAKNVRWTTRVAEHKWTSKVPMVK